MQARFYLYNYVFNYILKKIPKKKKFYFSKKTEIENFVNIFYDEKEIVRLQSMQNSFVSFDNSNYASSNYFMVFLIANYLFEV